MTVLTTKVVVLGVPSVNLVAYYFKEDAPSVIVETTVYIVSPHVLVDSPPSLLLLPTF